MNKLARRFYEFASFRVDAVERRLWCEGEIVPLTPKVFDILIALLENSGRTVEKEELIEKVWADTFVEEGNLNRNISTLRKILGDDSHEQRFIKTIPKQGYRFTADVREILDEEEELMLENKTKYQLKIQEEIFEDFQEGEKKDHRITVSPRLRVALVGIVLMLILAAVSAWMWNQSAKNEARTLALVTDSEKSEALELYRKGRELWQTRDGKDLHEATLLLEQAVQKDPNLALAHAALADAYAFDYRNWKKAENTAREAIRLDANLGEPHATIGFVKMFWEWKIQEAENEFKLAVRLSPNYATAHQWYAINLHAFGNSGNAAFAEMKKALELKPDSVSINADMCQTFYFLRRYDEAIAQCKKTLVMDDKSHNAYQYLYEIYTTKKMDKEAFETYFKIQEITLTPSPPDVLEKLQKAYQTGGIKSFWENQIEFLSVKSPLHYRIAQYHARLGKKDLAFLHLQKAYESRDFEFYLFLADPTFDELRTDRRYKELSDVLLLREK